MSLLLLLLLLLVRCKYFEQIGHPPPLPLSLEISKFSKLGGDEPEMWATELSRTLLIGHQTVANVD